MNTPNLFATFMADVASRISNAALNADPILQARLEQLSGTQIELKVDTSFEPPGQLLQNTWYLDLHANQVMFYPGQAPAPNVVVYGPLIDLAGWLFTGEVTGNVRIDGDETQLLDIIELFKGYQPDFGGPIEKIFGAELGSSLLGNAEVGLQSVRSIVAGVAENFGQTQSQTYVKQEQLETIMQSIDKLRLEVDRLNAQLKQQNSP